MARTTSAASTPATSCFTGLTVASPFLQTTLGLAMLLGRFVRVLAVLALARSLAAKRVQPDAGTLPTTGSLFGRHVVLVAALAFLPALPLGPIAAATRLPSRAGRPPSPVGVGAFAPGQLSRSMLDALR